MTDKVKDFVSTYKSKPTPEPFFGFFKEFEYTAKRVFKANRKPIYERVNAMVNRGQSDQAYNGTIESYQPTIIQGKILF